MAIEQYEQIVRLDPKSIEDHLLLGRLYRLNNETGKAESEFRAAVKLQPSSEDAVTTLALLYNEEGNFNRALDILQSVPEVNRSPRIYAGLGYTYEQKKDYKSAVAAYRKAVDLDQDNLDARRGLAQNLLSDNQNDAALEQYNAIAAADPQDVQTLLRISEIHRRDGQFDKAKEALDKAQAIAPDSMSLGWATPNCRRLPSPHMLACHHHIHHTTIQFESANCDLANGCILPVSHVHRHDVSLGQSQGLQSGHPH